MGTAGSSAPDAGAVSSAAPRLYYVLQHHAFGHVEGESFRELHLALARFQSLPFKVASMVVGPDGEELRYYGFRQGRDTEMLAWLADHLDGRAWSAQAPVRSRRPDLKSMFCVVWQPDGCDIQGEFFTTGSVARDCFRALPFKAVAIALAPDGTELAFHGLRAARREVALRRWRDSLLEFTRREQQRPASASRTAISDVEQAVREAERRSRCAPVLLHIYDVADHSAVVAVNKVLRIFGSGAFHAGIEVFGKEWSYGGLPEGAGYPPDMTGVGWYEPRACSFGKYRESVFLGRTTLTEADFNRMLCSIERAWPGHGYDLLSRNCCTFCDDLCQRLVVGQRVPRWVTRLPHQGSVLADVVADGMESRGDVTFCYQVGDIARGLVKKGKERRGAASVDAYRIGDIARGLLEIRERELQRERERER